MVQGIISISAPWIQMNDILLQRTECTQHLVASDSWQQPDDAQGSGGSFGITRRRNLSMPAITTSYTFVQIDALNNIFPSIVSYKTLDERG